jgi:hypothetical protein
LKKKTEIKNSKKTRGDFKSFGQNRIQKIEATRSAKFVEVKIAQFSRKASGFLEILIGFWCAAAHNRI